MNSKVTVIVLSAFLSLPIATHADSRIDTRDKLKAQELESLKKYTEEAQYQADSVSRVGNIPKIDLARDQEAWWKYVESYCDMKVSQSPSFKNIEKNTCEINWIRQRKMILWINYLHGDRIDVLEKPSTDLIY